MGPGRTGRLSGFCHRKGRARAPGNGSGRQEQYVPRVADSAEIGPFIWISQNVTLKSACRGGKGGGGEAAAQFIT